MGYMESESEGHTMFYERAVDYLLSSDGRYGNEIFCSFVYAFNLAEERKELWRDLKDHNDSPILRKSLWIIQEDFNEILSPVEHSGLDSSQDSLGMREFQATVQYCSLLDMSYQGPRFTWCNKRDNGVICKKLDCTLINKVWTRIFPQSYCVFEAGGCSDHQRCRIVIKSEIMKPRKPFKFVNALVDMPEFIPLVYGFWSETEVLFNSTSALFGLSKKLKSLKPILKQLSKEKVRAIVKKTKEAYTNLCEAQTKTLGDPTQMNIEAESVAYRRWIFLSTLEEKVLSQRAKILWLNVGDGNNKSYYRAAKV